MYSIVSNLLIMTHNIKQGDKELPLNTHAGHDIGIVSSPFCYVTLLWGGVQSDPLWFVTDSSSC